MPTLEGEWIYTTETARINGDDVGVKFSDGNLLIIRNSGLWQEGKYALSQDTIYIEKFGGVRSRYLINSYQSDSLTFSRGNHPVKLYSRRLEYNPDLKFDKIILETGGCDANCPKFFMVLNSNGDINFEGIYDSKYIGATNFKMDASAFHEVDSLFKWSYIDNLDTSKDYGFIDGWSINITFYYNGKSIKTITGTYSEMPFRLKGILAILIEVARKRELI